MKKSLALIGTLALSTVALAGCSVDGQGESNASGSGTSNATGCEGTNIAYLSPVKSVSFWRSLSVGVEGAAEGTAKVTVYDADNSQSKQLQNAQDAVTSGADAIILSPTDSGSAPAVLDIAAEANVPVVIADIGTESGDYVSYVKTDNTVAAEEAGAHLVEELKADGITSGEIAIVGISQSRQNGKDRTAGFTEVVEQAGFNVVTLLESKDYTRSEGLTFTQDLLSGYPDLVGIFSQHDEATQGALTALGGDLTPVLVGFDGSPDTLQALKDGTISGSAMQQPVLMGEAAFGAVCSYLDGETVEEETLVPTVFVSRDNVLDLEAEVQDTVFKE